MSFFRTLAKSILFFGDQNSIDIFSTHLLSTTMTDKFLTLLDLMVEQKRPTREMENAFISLISIHGYDIKIINQFLEVLGQSPSYLATHLMNDHNYNVLKLYIRQLGENFSEIILQHIVPSVLATDFRSREKDYFGVAEELLKIAPQLMETLLCQSKLGDCRLGFQHYLLSKDQISDFSVIKNFIHYLSECPERMSHFEDCFLERDKAKEILEYALEIPHSDKRKVLKRLVELKKEAVLVKFIENFPEYSSLLIML